MCGFERKTINTINRHNDTLIADAHLWHALRCSSAAPSYFTSVENKYIDGGLMANNPSLVLMQQADEYNSVCQMLVRTYFSTII